MHLPKQRSRIRLFLGNIYYTLRRRFSWYSPSVTFATQQQDAAYPVEIAHHSSLLLRKLKDVDMWMQYNKIHNLRLALACLDGAVIRPGETFSYWRLIGKPTKKRGFVDGMVLHSGMVTAGVGGGLCQLSNLIFWMTLHTPLTVTERWRHGYDVFPDAQRTLPFGSGATCAYPNIDLQIRNTTLQSFQLHLSLSETHLVGCWKSTTDTPTRYTVEERGHAITHEFWGGYIRNNELWRTTYEKSSGAVLDTSFLCANHAIMMYSPLLEEAA